MGKKRCFHPCHPCQWGNATPLDVQWKLKNSFLDIHNHKQSWFLGPLIFDAYGRDILAAVGLEARAGAAAPVEPRSRDTEISAAPATLRPHGPQSLRGPAADTTQQQHNIATRQQQLSTTFSHKYLERYLIRYFTAAAGSIMNRTRASLNFKSWNKEPT